MDSELPIRVIPLPGESLAYRLVIRWHPIGATDPAYEWLRGMLRDIAAKIGLLPAAVCRGTAKPGLQLAVFPTLAAR